MTQLVYNQEELCRSHDYAKPHFIGSQRLHGGFDADGSYIPPRALVREPAIEAWIDALRARGGDLLAADASPDTRIPPDRRRRPELASGLDLLQS